MRFFSTASSFAAVNAHECFNCAAGGECSHFAECNQFTGSCECPDGFGGANCKQPVCGSLPQGQRRPLRPENSTCTCSENWGGINCNMCTNDKACEPFMPSPGTGDARCYDGGSLVNTNFHMCEVTNRKVQDILAGQKAEVTFECTRNTSQCDLQSWVDEVESFFCKFDECEFNGLDYECAKIQCQCQPGESLCGKEGSIDITEWSQKSVKGPGTSNCEEDGKCSFQEPAMNQLIQFVFGDHSIELQCGASECSHYSQIPGYESPDKPKMSKLAVLGILSALFLAFAGIIYTIRRSHLANQLGGPGRHVAKSSGSLRLAGEQPISRVAPVGLYFDQISYRAASGKEILNRISGAVPPGHVLAILGGSGAGKTTSLDILAAKHKTGTVNGSVMSNSSPLTEDSPLRRLVGFVDQSDSTLVPTQTVFESVMFSAMSRLPRSMSPATKELRVLDTLTELGIAHLRNQIIGKGLSGGERRRVAIACELVTSPGISLLDEPTSGLDAYNAFAVVDTLVSLAKNANRTIVFTIHQPRSNIVSLFDRIMSLARGQLSFTGTVPDAQEFFEGMGYKAPSNYNFADYIVDVSMKASVAVPYSDDDTSDQNSIASSPGNDDTHTDDTEAHGNNDDTETGNGTADAPVTEDVLSDVSGEEDSSGPHLIEVDGEEVECPDPKVHTMPLGTDAPREWRDFAFHRAQISRSSAQAMANSQLSLGPQGVEPSVTAYRSSAQFVHLQSELEQAKNSDSMPEIDSLETKRASSLKQFEIISLRLIQNLYRDPMSIITHYGISVGSGLLCGYLYYDVSNDISGFQNRLGSFFFLLSVFGFSTSTSVSLFSRERLVFLRERANGYYHPFAYYAAKVLLDIVPSRLGPPSSLGLILYPLVGSNTEGKTPFVFLLVLASFNLSAATVILVIGIFFADFGVASLSGCMVNLFGILFAGSFLNQDSMPFGSGWIKYSSIYHYAYEALSVNEVKYSTSIEDKFGSKIEVPGAAILSAFGFDNGAVFKDVMGLIVASVLCVILGYAVLYKVSVERR